MIRNPWVYLGRVTVCLVVIHYNTSWHAFNVSDNRHYVFYIHRYLFHLLPSFKYALSLVYPLTLSFLANLVSS